MAVNVADEKADRPQGGRSGVLRFDARRRVVLNGRVIVGAARAPGALERTRWMDAESKPRQRPPGRERSARRLCAAEQSFQRAGRARVAERGCGAMSHRRGVGVRRGQEPEQADAKRFRQRPQQGRERHRKRAIRVREGSPHYSTAGLDPQPNQRYTISSESRRSSLFPYELTTYGDRGR